jgi:hypothetical protein
MAENKHIKGKRRQHITIYQDSTPRISRHQQVACHSGIRNTAKIPPNFEPADVKYRDFEGVEKEPGNLVRM